MGLGLSSTFEPGKIDTAKLWVLTIKTDTQTGILIAWIRDKLMTNPTKTFSKNLLLIAKLSSENSVGSFCEKQKKDSFRS